MKELLEEGIIGDDPAKDKKIFTKRFKNSLKVLLVLSGIYLFLTMIILVGCIWQVDSGTYRIVGTIMVFMIPVFLFELSRSILWYKLMTDKKNDRNKGKAIERTTPHNHVCNRNIDTDGGRKQIGTV